MITHGYFIIDANGADISKFIHGINLYYAVYYNVRHERHGHLFQDRFKHTVVDSESIYFITLLTFIITQLTFQAMKHALKSSNILPLGLYLGLAKDNFGMVDEELVLGFSAKESNRQEKSTTALL